MALSPGARLGPYEVVAPLGAGGMGEVYRAKDTRLDRTVALKVLPENFLESEEGKARFEREARALAALNHPNIAVVYAFEEIPASSGSPRRHLLAMELLEGESLRVKLGAPLPPKKAVEYALQVAHGLAAAHEKGIVHRDLKPENLFVTRDGRIKILDFGVARLTQPAVPSASLTQAPTEAPRTEPGVVMGTVGYMSPEQVQGKQIDARSDLFSLGVVLYEMLSGKRPFQKETAPETMAAILREEPPELSGTNRPVPPGLDRIARHCLEKEPSNRFQSARDVAFALESLSQATTAETAPLRAPRGKRRLAVAGLGIALLAAGSAGLFKWTKKADRAPAPSFKRITFKRGTVKAARFTPDFQSVVYSASWEGKPSELFVQRLASPGARPLGVIDATVAGTAGGDTAIIRGEFLPLAPAQGTLAQLPLEGGTPRDLLKGVDDASWDRSGTRFAVVRGTRGRQRLEYPVGKVLLEATGQERLSNPRFSPDGTRIAFFFMPNGHMDPSGDVCVVDLSGQKRTLSKNWIWAGGAWEGLGGGLAWSADGNEVWFSATRAGAGRALYAVTLSGQERLVTRLPGSLLLQDIAPDGRVLLTFGQTLRVELRGKMAGDSAERDLSWLDGTFSPVLASDGTQMAFQESADGGTAEGSAYHWRMGSPTPKRLGDGSPVGVSPDWTTALVVVGLGEKTELKLVPIGAGETTTVPRGAIHAYYWGLWHPDGKRFVIVGTDAEGKTRLFVQDVGGGLPRAFAELEGFPSYPWLSVSADGRFVAAKPKESEPYALHPIDGGEIRPIPFLKADETPLVFSDDGGSLFLTGDAWKFPLRILRLDLKTGRRDPWLELAPPDRAGVYWSFGSWLTPNGRFYAYSYARVPSDLYMVEGLR